MRVLILTKILPNRVEPLSSPFNRQQFAHLARLCDLQVLATIPWFPGARALESAIVLYIGHIERQNGSLDLVRAFAALAKRRKNASLVMVGDGAGMADCQKLAAELRADVSFVGAKPHDEVPRWIAACDVFALPSWNEALAAAIEGALSRAYDAAAVSAALDAPDWGESAQHLHASLMAACESSARVRAA